MVRPQKPGTDFLQSQSISKLSHDENLVHWNVKNLEFVTNILLPPETTMTIPSPRGEPQLSAGAEEEI